MRNKEVQLYPVSRRFSPGDTGAVLDATLETQWQGKAVWESPLINHKE